MYSTTTSENSVARLLKSILRDVAPMSSNTVAALQTKLLAISKQHKSMHSSPAGQKEEPGLGVQAIKKRILQHPRRNQTASLVGFSSTTGCFPYLKKKPYEYQTYQLDFTREPSVHDLSPHAYLKRGNIVQNSDKKGRSRVKNEEIQNYQNSYKDENFPFKKKRRFNGLSKTTFPSPTKSKPIERKYSRDKKSSNQNPDNCSNALVLEQLSQNSGQSDQQQPSQDSSQKGKSNMSTVQNTVVISNSPVNEQEDEDDKQKTVEKKYRRSQMNVRLSGAAKLSHLNKKKESRLSGISESYEDAVKADTADISESKKKEQLRRSSGSQKGSPVNARAYRKRQKHVLGASTLDQNAIKKLLQGDKVNQKQQEDLPEQNDSNINSVPELETPSVKLLINRINDIISRNANITEFLILPEDSPHVKAIKMAGLKQYLYLTNNKDTELWELINEFESRLLKCIQRYLELKPMDCKEDKLLLSNILMKVDMTESELNFTDGIRPVTPESGPGMTIAEKKQVEEASHKQESDENQKRFRLLNSSVITMREEIKIIKAKRVILQSQSYDRNLIQKEMKNVVKCESIGDYRDYLEPKRQELSQAQRRKLKLKTVIRILKRKNPDAFQGLFPPAKPIQ